VRRLLHFLVCCLVLANACLAIVVHWHPTNSLHAYAGEVQAHWMLHLNVPVPQQSHAGIQELDPPAIYANSCYEETHGTVLPAIVASEYVLIPPVIQRETRTHEQEPEERGPPGQAPSSPRPPPLYPSA
jgi:hypothetical protein